MHLQSYQGGFFPFPSSTTPDSFILFVQQNLALNSRDTVSAGEQGARQKKLTLPSLPSLSSILIPTCLVKVVSYAHRFSC